MNAEAENVASPEIDPVRELSHDARNSLYALRTAVDILKASPPVCDADASLRLGELLEWMERDIGRAAQSIDKLVALARKK